MNFVIRPMRLDDLPRVVEFHRLYLPDTWSSKIGSSYLKGLYRGILTGVHDQPTLVAHKGETIMGVITGTVDLGRTHTLLTRGFFWHNTRLVLRAILRGKISIGELVSQIYAETVIRERLKHPYLMILTLFVTERFRRHGIGKKLVYALISSVPHRQGVYVDTLANNNGALHFYQAMGFRQQAHIANRIFLAKHYRSRSTL